ncbi:MAG: hypothetical protein AAGD06_32460 [Acidobacteriota bacterium]
MKLQSRSKPTTYTVAEALAKGVLVSGWKGKLADVTALFFKDNQNVYLCRDLHALMEQAGQNPGTDSDCQGVWRHVLTHWQRAARAQPRRRPLLGFAVRIVGAGKRDVHRLLALYDANGLTVFLRKESDPCDS